MAVQLLEGATMRFAVYVPPAKRTIRGRRRARGRSKALGYRSLDCLPFVDEAGPYPDPLPLPSLLPLHATFLGDVDIEAVRGIFGPPGAITRLYPGEKVAFVGSTPNLDRGLMERVLGEAGYDLSEDADVIEVRSSDGSWMQEPTPTRYRGKRR
jgi:hypothetical protein